MELGGAEPFDVVAASIVESGGRICPASVDEIGDAERRLGVRFPLSYRTYLRRFGHVSGGTTEFIGLGAEGSHLDLITRTEGLRGLSGWQQTWLPLYEPGDGAICYFDAATGHIGLWDGEAIADEGESLAAWMLSTLQPLGDFLMAEPSPVFDLDTGDPFSLAFDHKGSFGEVYVYERSFTVRVTMSEFKRSLDDWPTQPLEWTDGRTGRVFKCRAADDVAAEITLHDTVFERTLRYRVPRPPVENLFRRALAHP